MEAPFLALHRFAQLIGLINLGIFAAAFADEYGFYDSAWFPLLPFALGCAHVVVTRTFQSTDLEISRQGNA